MAGVRIREAKGFYIVEAGGRTYRLPKQYVEKTSDTALESRKTGYRFRGDQRGPAHHTTNQGAKNSEEAVSAGPPVGSSAPPSLPYLSYTLLKRTKAAATVY